MLVAGWESDEEFVEELVQNNLSMGQATGLLENLYLFYEKDYNDMCWDVLNSLMKKVNFNDLCYRIANSNGTDVDCLRSFIKRIFNQLNTVQDGLPDWFDNIFIGQKQYVKCSAKVKESVAIVIVSDFVDEDFFRNSATVVKYVNQTLGTT